jgi:hypothetical protein
LDENNLLLSSLDGSSFNLPSMDDIQDFLIINEEAEIEAMEELGLGPNGGLVYCMEYLMNNLD